MRAEGRAQLKIDEVPIPNARTEGHDPLAECSFRTIVYRGAPVPSPAQKSRNLREYYFLARLIAINLNPSRSGGRLKFGRNYTLVSRITRSALVRCME
jgi:hypothetical protein